MQKKWSEGKNNWHQVYIKLLPSGWFQWFDSSTSTSPKRSVNVKTVAAYLAFGDVINRVPCKPSSITPVEVPLAFGIPHEPHMGTRVSWFVCTDPNTVNEWRNAILGLVYGGGTPSGAVPGPPPPYEGQPFSVPQPAGPIGFAMPNAADFGGNPAGYYSDMSLPNPGPMVPPTPNYPNYNQPAPNFQTPGVSNYPRQPASQTYYTPGAPGQPPSNQAQYFTGSNGQPYQVVYVSGKPKKKKLGGLGSAAVGLASGLAGGYMVSRLFGGGWGGGFGLGRWGSWSSLSSLSWSD